MKKIVTVIGARPQFVKAAIVSRALRKLGGNQEVLVHTGQHYDANMSQLFFDELEMPEIRYNLGIAQPSHGKQTGLMLMGIEEVLQVERPDWLLIYGDTNSTLAGAIAAAKLHIPIAHVEAGLRSHNRRMPEEINRLVADQLSSVLFTPTAVAEYNLKMEGFDPARIYAVGDVMYDAALYYGEKALKQSTLKQQLGIEDGAYLLVTIHRAENTDEPNRLKAIFLALAKLAERHRVVLPLHPRTRKMLDTHLPGYLSQTSINILEPLGFLDMMNLEKGAGLIMTDSGGVQKEAFFYGVPCLTLRDETEWVETVELGWNQIVKPRDPQTIIAAAEAALKSCGQRNHYPYGRGDAAQKIAQHLTLEAKICEFG